MSVVIPAFNVQEFIKYTLESILTQTYQHIQLIVVDDGSIDNTPTVVQGISDKRLEYYHKENEGVSKARNYGFEKILGEYVVFFDSDDLMSPNFLEKRLQLLSEEDQYDGVCSDVIKIDCNGIELNRGFESTRIQSDIFEFKSNAITCPSGYMYRSKVLARNKLTFDENLQSSADKFYLVNFLKNHRIGRVTESPLLYRILSDSMSNKVTKKLVSDQISYLKRLKEDNLIPEKYKKPFVSHVHYSISGMGLKAKCYHKCVKHALVSLIISPLTFFRLKQGLYS